MAKTRILVVDEHPLLRYGIIAFIEGQPDMIACGEADSVPERAEQALGNQAAPDGYRVTIGGLATAWNFLKQLRHESPSCWFWCILLLRKPSLPSARCPRAQMVYVMKKAPKEELAAAIREIVQGGIYVSREVTIRAFKKSLEQRSENRLSHAASAVENLSDREMHVFRLLGSGLGKRQIARSLNLSVKNDREPSGQT